ncbi:HDIG domain-containing metalloprotein [Mycoplasma ovis]|nr:HDIG domain-containing metalloprotein [Mycoplasma ovis]
MIRYLSKYKSPRLFSGCYFEIKLSDSKNFNEKTIGQLVGKSGERKEEFFSLTGVKPHIEYSDEPPTLILSKYNPRDLKIAHLLGERFKTSKSWSSSSINKHFKQLEESLIREERTLGEQVLAEYWPEKVTSHLATLVGRMQNERYSPSQTLLAHSKEIAREVKKLAEALSLDSVKLQRMALLHDIGKIVLPYYQHTSSKVLELIPELNEDIELSEVVTSHHNPLGSFNSPYVALVTLINRVISQSHFINLGGEGASAPFKESIEKLLTSKVEEAQISHFYVVSSFYHFWFILRFPKENQEELTRQLTDEIYPLTNKYLNSENVKDSRESNNLSVTLFWLPEVESEEKISFTRLKLLDSVPVESNDQHIT